jgi:hypothetical protein
MSLTLRTFSIISKAGCDDAPGTHRPLCAHQTNGCAAPNVIVPLLSVLSTSVISGVD